MTTQRYSDIEDAVLIGLLDAPAHNEQPFKLDPEIFTTTLKRKIALTINKYIDENEPEMALFTIENFIDSDERYQPEWIDIHGNASKLGFSLPISAINRYYYKLIEEYKLQILKGLR
jgi:hypothetical protein